MSSSGARLDRRRVVKPGAGRLRPIRSVRLVPEVPDVPGRLIVGANRAQHHAQRDVFLSALALAFPLPAGI